MTRIVKSLILLSILAVVSESVYAFGPPLYFPDGNHPRIFLTPSILESLRAKVVANDQDWLDLKARADTLVTYSVPAYDRNAWPNNAIPYSYEGSQWLEAAQVLGIAYKVSGNVAYANKLRQLIDVINAAGIAPIIVDSGYPSRTVAVAMALMYDWLYDFLDSTTKNAMITTINSYYASYVAGTGWYSVTGPAYDNYFGGHLLGFGLCGYATYGDNPTAPSMISDIRAKWNNVVPAAFSTGGFAGGANLESYNYGPNHFIRLFQYGLATQTATGEDIYTSYGAKVADNLTYNLKPNRWQSTIEGDMPGTYAGVMPSNLSIVLSSFIPGVAGDQMAYFYSHLAPTPDQNATDSIQKADAYIRFLFKVPRNQADYRLTKPLEYRSSGDEHIFMRSDWSDNAVYVSYMAGNIRLTGHGSNTAGHIVIHRGNDYLLVDSGQWKGQDGLQGVPSNFNTASKWSNTLYFTDGGDYLYGTGGTVGAYAGGQMSLFPDKNLVLAYEVDPKYVYAKSDHTNAYDIRADSRSISTRSLRYYYRNMVYLRPGIVILYDRVKALKSTYTKVLYFHLNKNGQPVVVDNRTTSSTVGSSKLFIRSIYPTSSTVSFAQDISDSGGITTPRVELADSVIATDFNPLTVLIADSSSTNNVTTVGIDTTNMLGVEVSGTQTKVVLFSKDGTYQNAVTYTAEYSSGIVGEHLLVDMQPGIYDVYKDSVRIISAAVASDQGVLSFSATGGSQFKISSTTGLTAPQHLKIAQ